MTRIHSAAFAYFAALVAWVRARAGAVADALDVPEPPTRNRGVSRGGTDSKTIVATGAGVAASGGLVTLIKDYLIGGSLYATSIEAVEAIQAFGSFGAVLSTFANSVADLVGAGLPSEIIDAGVTASSQALRQNFGISGFPVAVVVTMVGIALFIMALSNIDWSPLKIFFGGRE